MAFSAAPNAWFDGMSEDGTTISIPIASFPELTAAEADGATGDIRKVVYAVMEKLHSEFTSRADADRPTKLQISKGASYNQATGQLTVTYSVTTVLGFTGIDVVAE